MLLDRLSYIQFRGDQAEWDLEGFALGQINLLVGRNSVGKTRIINIITSLANRFLAGSEAATMHQGEYKLVFHNQDKTWDYSFEFDVSEIIREDLLFNGQNVLHRGMGGMGQIDAMDVEGGKARLKFKAPLKQLSVVSKRDPIQHPYLEELHEWADSLRIFRFGSGMGSDRVLVRIPKNEQLQVNALDEKESNLLAPILDNAMRVHGDKFAQSVIADMDALGYPITEITIRRPHNLRIHSPLPIPGEAVGVAVKEKDLPVHTDQVNMSQGMFCALSLLIQITNYMMSNKSGCILIDDIGEGLDFERSRILTDIVRDKALRSSFQLIMSTNNRYVMNNVPLEEWCFVERAVGKVRVRNYENSKSAFEQFKQTGLNNFDLLATDYLQGK